MSNYENEDDGLGSFSPSQLGMKTGAFGGARILKFTKPTFTTREGEVIEPTRELLSLGLVKVVQKFVGKQLLETIPVGPRDDFPDVEAMNLAAPQAEWGIGLDGKPKGPYSRLLILKLLDLATMDRYAFITSSIGGSIAVGDLSDKCKIRRRLQGNNVAPIVTLGTTLFKTHFNPNDRRPDFKIVRWIELAGDPALTKPAAPLQLGSGAAAPAPTPGERAHTQLNAFAAAAPAVAPEAAPIGKPLADPTLREELADEVPF